MDSIKQRYLAIFFQIFFGKNFEKIACKILLGLCFLFLIPTNQAFAIEIESAVAPSDIQDQKLQIGSRILTLPAGHWALIAKTAGHVSLTGQIGPASYAAFAVDLTEKELTASVVLTLPASSFFIQSYNVSTCSMQNVAYKEDLTQNPRFPQCLLVIPPRRHLINSTGEIFITAQNWVESRSVKVPQRVFEIVYLNLTSSDMGNIRIFIPESNEVTEAAVITWAKSLPPILAPFFSKRTTEATLPPLPSALAVSPSVK